MKKIFIFILAVMMVLLCGCGNANKKDDGVFSIVCTVFPQYSFAKELTKGAKNVEVSLILDDGTDFHSYQPTADDIIKIKESDLLISVGGSTDTWAKDAAENGTICLDLMEILGENILEESHEHGEESHVSEDEHVYLSVKNAIIFSEEICGVLCELDVENSGIYKSNLEEYTEKLSALDKEYKEAAESASKEAIIFADRYPFTYLFRDYDIECFAAFPGCSSETDASFETIVSLSDKMKEYGITNLAVLEGSGKKTADAIISAAGIKGAEVTAFNSMQSLSKADIDSGVSYYEIMCHNLEMLKAVLE